jgi:uncharacterized protein (DUF1501 family)
MNSPLPYSRRLFLKHGVTLASMAASVPTFIQRSALGVISNQGPTGDRILVIIQLGGGNDGLNTVVPFGSSEYYAARPSLAIGGPGRPRDQAGQALVLDADRGIGLHPNLTGLKELFDRGDAAVIQGVGYPNPNRSHFTSMDIWQTGQMDGKGTGWVGRYFDCTCNGTPVSDGAIAIGQAPLAMMGDTQKPIAFESADLFRWLGSDLHEALDEPYRDITRAGPLEGVEADSQMGFLMRTTLDAQVSSDRIRAAVGKEPLVSYPRSSLGNQLRTIGALIRDGLGTRVYYASISGFDTHGGQLGTHGNLMRQFGDALLAFQNDLKAQGNDGRVATLCFSEFGRRVAQNGSAGTDHGTAGPVFLVGSEVRPGLLGDHPSMTDLDGGDLKYTVDFRSVYAGILDDWLKAPADKVLGAKFPRAKLF